jgi:hypothetical protein
MLLPNVLGSLETANINYWTNVSHSPEDGNISSFRNVVFSCFYNTRRWTQSKNPVIPGDIL